MTKPRARYHADGRVGFPNVRLYRLVEGPAEGQVLDVPPLPSSHPAPVRPRVVPNPESPTLFKTLQVNVGCAYLVKVLDSKKAGPS